MDYRNRQKGTAIVIAAILLPVLLGGLGLVIDNGQAYDTKRRLQKAADAGAMAAAHQLRRGEEASFKLAAYKDAELNGVDVDDAIVNVYRPPITGPRTGDMNYVEVEIRKSSPAYFMKALYEDDVLVEARATAGVLPKQKCVFAMDESASPGLTVAGNAKVNLAKCGVHVNSDASRAARSMGNVEFEADSFDVVGGYTGTGFTPPPLTGADVVEDPLADLPAPIWSGCDHSGVTKIQGPATLSPGVYCGGIVANAGADITLQAGVFILAGGGLTINGGAKVKGDGVMFYNTAAAGYAYEPVFISGEAAVQLTAPKVMPYASVLFFQDRSIVSKFPNQIAGGPDSYFEGALYFLTSPLILIGDSGTTVHELMIVAAQVQFQGNMRLEALGPASGLSPYTLRAALVY